MIIKEYYTKEEMIKSAATEGLTISKASFEDWQDKGLIGKAHKRIWPGPNYNSGSISWWSFEQHALLILLLKVRDSGWKKIRALCNLPVGYWLYYGELRDVSLEQVKLTMKTFADDADRDVFREDVRKSVAELIEMIAGTGAQGKRQFLNEYVDVRAPRQQKRGQSGHEFPDEETLLYHVRTIMDPKDRNEPMRVAEGKDWNIEFRVEGVVDHIIGRALGIKHLSDFPDEIWRWARTCLQMELAEEQEISDLAARDRVDLKSHPALKNRFKEKPSPQTRIGRSCYDLLAWLGLSMREKSLTRLPWYMQPKLWKEKKVSSVTACALVPSPIISPSGKPFKRWETSICIYSGKGLTLQYEIDKDNIHWIGKIASITN